jgi:predicted dithiol-disulfide oxidoreductase (DUF899 family)
MGWTFRWVPSATSDFNFDYHVSFPKGMRERGVFYNFEQRPDPEVDELSGTSVFHKHEDGTIYRTYSPMAAAARCSWLSMAAQRTQRDKEGQPHRLR